MSPSFAPHQQECRGRTLPGGAEFSVHFGRLRRLRHRHREDLTHPQTEKISHTDREDHTQRDRLTDRERERQKITQREARGVSRARTAAQTRTAQSHTRACAATLKLFAGSSVWPFHSCVVPVPTLFQSMMTSSQDVLFNLGVEMLPKPLASAMVKNGLMNPAVFSYYPRKTAEELGLAPVQESKVRKVAESVGFDGIVYGGIDILLLWLLGIWSGTVSVQNVPMPLCGVQVQVESQAVGVSPKLVKTWTNPATQSTVHTHQHGLHRTFPRCSHSTTAQYPLCHFTDISTRFSGHSSPKLGSFAEVENQGDVSRNLKQKLRTCVGG